MRWSSASSGIVVLLTSLMWIRPGAGGELVDSGASDNGDVAVERVRRATHVLGWAPSGESMPRGDLPGWRQIFTDDFTNGVGLGAFPAAVGARWGAYPSPWRDTSDDGLYAPSRVVDISGGLLNKHLRTEGGEPLVAALTPKLAGSAEHGVTYGRFAVRFRSDRIPGYKVAWLLWPDSGKRNRDGEIDFPEMDLDATRVSGFVHHRDASSSADQEQMSTPMDLDGWHTAVIEWSPGLIVFELDGIEVGRTAERIPNKPMHWVIQTETSLRDKRPPPAGSEGVVQIDWVAAWAYEPRPPNS